MASQVNCLGKANCTISWMGGQSLRELEPLAWGPNWSPSCKWGEKNHTTVVTTFSGHFLQMYDFHTFIFLAQESFPLTESYTNAEYVKAKKNNCSGWVGGLDSSQKRQVGQNTAGKHLRESVLSHTAYQTSLESDPAEPTFLLRVTVSSPHFQLSPSCSKTISSDFLSLLGFSTVKT